MLEERPARGWLTSCFGSPSCGVHHGRSGGDQGEGGRCRCGVCWRSSSFGCGADQSFGRERRHALDPAADRVQRAGRSVHRRCPEPRYGPGLFPAKSSSPRSITRPREFDSMRSSTMKPGSPCTASNSGRRPCAISTSAAICARSDTARPNDVAGGSVDVARPLHNGRTTPPPPQRSEVPRHVATRSSDARIRRLVVSAVRWPPSRYGRITRLEALDMMR